MANQKDQLRYESLSIHAGKDVHRVYSGTGAVTTPIYTTTSFVFNNSQHGADIFAGRAEDYAYSRLGNPTLGVLEQRIAALEGGAASLAAASGEAARWMAIFGLASAGENIISSATIAEDAYNHFKYSFPSRGISVKFVDTNDADAIRNAIDDQTRAVYIESISSVGLDIADIKLVASIAHEAGIPLIVDNTAGAAGYLIRPIDHGADIVVHASSEWITGSGTVRSGIIIDSGKFHWAEHAERFAHLTTPAPGYHGLNFCEKFDALAYIFYVRMAILRDVGPSLNPFAATFALAGLASLSPRLDRHHENALILARWLASNGKVSRVIFPGLPDHQKVDRAETYLRQRNAYGAILYFGIVGGGVEAAKALVANLKMIGESDGVGNPQTLIYLPNVALSPRPGITEVDEAFFRVSVGLENSNDIIEDIEQALNLL
ncbi:O-acetylhomoserine-lyase [Penicillium canariense]|uniref:O-acetylhomoserine-lyase n=1 Tax=Penicillium canariense TaxID=189055 RepID=A0A9W9IGF4_9EURO|nr:O-acetylhomoserine-lyase [Penicillium canariense]KAJ5175972.1 O-acetylhomoserine-lyase [Penicillium canariense]